jgi:hypothetical protein
MYSLSGLESFIVQSPEGAPQTAGTLVVAACAIATRRRSSQATRALVVASATVQQFDSTNREIRRQMDVDIVFGEW